MKRIAMILAASAALHAHAVPTEAQMRELMKGMDAYSDATNTCHEKPLLAQCGPLLDKVIAYHERAARMYAEYCAAHRSPDFCEAGNTANRLGIESMKADRAKFNAAKSALGK